MQADISLLWRMKCLKIIQPFPSLQIFCAHNTGRSYRSREIIHTVILALGTEYAVNIPVFMFCKTHIVYICLFRANIRKLYRIIPEAETIYTVITLCDSEKRLPVISLNTRNKTVFTVQIYSTRIHNRIDPQPFHKIRVGFRIKVKSPG